MVVSTKGSYHRFVILFSGSIKITIARNGLREKDENVFNPFQAQAPVYLGSFQYFAVIKVESWYKTNDPK